MSATSIEWTDRTWNPTRGCKPVSEGCRNCYAERMAARNLPEMRSPTTGKPFAVRTPAGPRWTGAVELIQSKLDEPLRWRKPQRIFVNSMSDLFHESLPDEAIDRVFAVMAQARHTFQILTKRPARMRAYGGAMAALSPKDRTRRLVASMYRGHPAEHLVSGPAPDERVGDLRWPLPNVWLGVSVEDQATADERIPLLLQTPAAVRFVSYEPALGPVDFRPYVALLDVLCCPRCGFRTNRNGHGPCPNDGATLGPDVRLDWLIVGGESGPGARGFDYAWARAAVAQCRTAGVPVFVKQMGSSPYEMQRVEGTNPLAVSQYLVDRKGGDMEEWPSDLRVREFPVGA